MAASTNSDTALLTEHFGYPPVSLLDDIINSVNILAERALNSVEQGLLSVPPATLGFRAQPKPSKNGANSDQSSSTDEALAAAARLEIESGTHQLETLLCAAIDRNFDKLEIYAVRNIICVRPEDRDWLRLGHYEGLSFDDLGGEEESGSGGGGDKTARPTVESVTNLRRRLQASQRLHALLAEEQARNAALLARLRGLLGAPPGATTSSAATSGSRASFSDTTAVVRADDPAASVRPPPLAFLREAAALSASDASAPLATTAAFSLSQLGALRGASAALQVALPELRRMAEEGGQDDEEGGGSRTTSWRRERVGYVEAQARRALLVQQQQQHGQTRHPQNRGALAPVGGGRGGRPALELEADGAVRDGEWQGESRALREGEVADLERVVALLGGAGGNVADGAVEGDGQDGGGEGEGEGGGEMQGRSTSRSGGRTPKGLGKGKHRAQSGAGRQYEDAMDES